MNLYHGTTEECADELAGRPELVSVEKGGGELGRGFYMGDHIALAASWHGDGIPGGWPYSKLGSTHPRTSGCQSRL